MATSLKTLVQNRIASNFAADEENLEDGLIYTFCSGRVYGCFTNCFAWCAPAAGTAKIEIWGAGGSTGCMCCCHYSIGGQSGAYAKKEVTFAQNGYVCGNVGTPCMPNAGFCYPNCSEATCVSICLGLSAGQCSCMCAQGGNGGFTGCHTGQSNMCCLQKCCFGTVANPNSIGSGCGYSCGCRNTYHVSIASGGDVNCPGTYACTAHWTCDGSANTSYVQHSNAIPHGQNATKQVTNMVAGNEGYTMGNQQSGQGNMNLRAGTGAVNPNSNSGFGGFGGCWASQSMCACYETFACLAWNPAGQGAPYSIGCPNVRHVGNRGGLGYVRILFKAT